MADFKKVLKAMEESEIGLRNYTGPESSIDLNDLNKRAILSLNHLHSRLFHSALKEAEGVLQINQNFEKAIASKIQSLWGLNKYEKALKYVESFQISKNSLEFDVNFKKIHEKAVKFLNQSKGQYNMMEIAMADKGQFHDIAEFKGPLEISEIPGKGRGLVATSDIQQGDLILVSKAFAVVFRVDEILGIKDPIDILVQICCQKLSINSEIRAEFAKLCPGNRYNSNKCWIWGNTEDLKVEMVKEVKNRVENNNIEGNYYLGEEEPTSVGIWILPSYFNNDCIDANVVFECYGDALIARAFKDIKSGQELTITYGNQKNPERIKMLSFPQRFTCNCRLCQFELKESETTKNTIKKILDSIKKDLKASRKLNVNTLLNRLKLIVSLRGEENIELNMAVRDESVRKLFQILFDKNLFKAAVDVMESMRNASFNAGTIFTAVQQDTFIIYCYLRLGLPNQMMKWVKILKKDLLIAYGETQMFEVVGQKFLDFWKYWEVTNAINFFELLN